jgi:hypothetical protein
VLDLVAVGVLHLPTSGLSESAVASPRRRLRPRTDRERRTGGASTQVSKGRKVADYARQAEVGKINDEAINQYSRRLQGHKKHKNWFIGVSRLDASPSPTTAARMKKALPAWSRPVFDAVDPLPIKEALLAEPL